MDTREYFEKVMQDYNQNCKGRSLRKYCKDEAVDYNWLMEYKKTYMSIDIKSRIPALHAELKRMQSRISELQVRQKQHPEDELQIRGELDMLNERQLEVMDVMVEVQEYILGKYETLLAFKNEHNSLLASKTNLENELCLREEKLNSKICNLLKIK